MAELIEVELAYVSPTRQYLKAFQVKAGTQAKALMVLADLTAEFPELAEQIWEVGVFSQRVSLDYRLDTGDRLEVYRPLTVDPKSARKHRNARSS